MRKKSESRNYVTHLIWLSITSRGFSDIQVKGAE